MNELSRREWSMVRRGGSGNKSLTRPDKIRVHSESPSLVRHLNGEYRVEEQKLRLLYRHALTLLRQFDSCRILYVYREKNKVSIPLVHRGTDEASRR